MSQDYTKVYVNNISSLASNDLAQGRITLTTATPVTTSDVTAATTLYFTPFRGNQIALYDGSSAWNIRTFAELSLAVPATTSTMYDLFAYDNAGVTAIESLVWTNDTTRATGLVWQDGVLVKSGATTRRYIGSFRTTTSSGQCEDSLAKRYIWNYYNRVLRPMKVVDTTDSWNYSTASYRQANANTANQLDFIIGWSEDLVFANVVERVLSSTATSRSVQAGIGLDSTTVNSAGLFHYTTVTNGAYQMLSATFNAPIAVGRHTLVWLEMGGGTDTQTWYGDNGGVSQQGITGFMWG